MGLMISVENRQPLLEVAGEAPHYYDSTLADIVPSGDALGSVWID